MKDLKDTIIESSSLFADLYGGYGSYDYLKGAAIPGDKLLSELIPGDKLYVYKNRKIYEFDVDKPLVNHGGSYYVHVTPNPEYNKRITSFRLGPNNCANSTEYSVAGSTSMDALREDEFVVISSSKESLKSHVNGIISKTKEELENQINGIKQQLSELQNILKDVENMK